MGEDPSPIQFGDYVVDPSDRRLLGPQGPIHIGGRAFGVLSSLLSANGRLVTKDELFEEVWEGLAVSDAALTSVIRELRIALGDRDTHGTITAVYGKGYRLNAEQTEVGPASLPTSGLQEARNKLAVLPFDNLSADPDMDYFSDGISEEILSVVSRGTDIPTIGKLSSFSFRGEAKAKAPSELKVSHILDGSVRKLGNEVRITAHLLDVTQDETLWSENFDAGVTDLLSTQVRIAEAIAERMELQFTHQERGEISPEMYDLYLRAIEVSRQRIHNDVQIALLERVTREAPGYAPAWGKLASSYALYRMVRPVEEWPRIMNNAREAIARARAIDADDLHAHSAEYQLVSPVGAYERRFEILAAMAGKASNTAVFNFFYSWHLILIGRMKDACGYAAHAAELDPDDLPYSTFAGSCLYYAGYLDEARTKLLAEYGRNPDDYHVLAALLNCAAIMKDKPLVRKLLEPENLARHPLGEYAYQEVVAKAILDDEQGEWARLVGDIRQRLRASGGFDLGSAIYLARFASPSEAHDLIAELPISLNMHSDMFPDFVANASLLLFLKDFSAIRQDPRFAILCARLGLAQFWTEHDIWPDCADDETWGYDLRTECFKAVETTPVDPPLLAL
ncbi:winged helix-turn-helix domain-containing protein [Altererythrobacter sp. MF3-039]|uniref:winged helix-turn-helix domain-containing protein n=1 Tax=Altererythrobacter sp. MF3-039 TaxID=3252901 RepID=UPI00390C6C84